MNWNVIVKGLGLGAIIGLGAVALLYVLGGDDFTQPVPAVEKPPVTGIEVAPKRVQPQPSIEPPIAAVDEPLPKVDETSASVASAVPEETLDPIPAAPHQVDGSDAYVFEALGRLSPIMMRWFTPEEQVRKWVLAVDLMADGKLPQRHRPIRFAMDKFGVESRGDYYYSVPENNTRMQTLVDAVVALDPKTVGRYYREWLPVLERAYDELGKAGSFKNRVGLMIARVQEVGPAPKGAKMHRPHVFYEYVDENLENASDLDKWLWRLGDDNREALQAWVKEVRFYL